MIPVLQLLVMPVSGELRATLAGWSYGNPSMAGRLWERKARLGPVVEHEDARSIALAAALWVLGEIEPGAAAAARTYLSEGR